jgi:hypothetical protein
LVLLDDLKPWMPGKESKKIFYLFYANYLIAGRYYFPKFSLLDINECSKGTHTCHQNADCSNIVGSFTCQCHGGFTGSGHVCTGKLWILL